MDHIRSVVDETVACVAGATAPEWYGPTLFGGFVVGQATYHAAVAAPEDKRLTSMHGHFLRPMVAGTDVDYAIELVKDGRTVCLQRVESSQQGKPVFAATCSYMSDVDGGYQYEMPPSVEVSRFPEDIPAWDGDDIARPFDNRWIGPSERRADGSYAATHRTWIRVARSIPDEPELHAAFIAYFTDMTGPGSRPLLLEPDLTGIVSLDHSLWFHRPARADEWLYYELDCVLNHAGRSLVRGVVRDRAMRPVVSMAQELIVTPT